MIDSHAHVLFDSFDKDRDEVFARARAAGVEGWIEVGTTVDDSRAAVEFSRENDGIWATVGVHPNDIGELTEARWQELAELAQAETVVAIGEVGFDFSRDGELETQGKVLERFLELARQRELPVVFHVRDGKAENAHERLLELLETYPDERRPRGVIHTFSGTLDQAQRYLALGLYLSFSGVITFRNAGPILDAAKSAPLDRILIETDCPFLTPEPHRGERNEPAYVRFVAEKIAQVRSISLEKIQKTTNKNTHELFRFA